MTGKRADACVSPQAGMAEAPLVGAVLLSAGQGTRFGPQPKLLAEIEGVPLVRRVALAALASRARPVVAVLGAHAGAVRAALAGLDIRFVDNPDFASGLSGSLRAGLAALPNETEAALVLLGDMPWIEARHCDALIAARAGTRAAAIVPTWRGRRGNPVLIDHRRLAATIAGLDGDHGAGPLLRARADVVEVALDAAVRRDVDTPDALAAVSARSGRPPPAAPDSSG